MTQSPATSRVAVVTGGSRGIGRATAARLASEGLAVVVGYAGRAEAARAVVEEVTAGGGRAIAVRADVATRRTERPCSTPRRPSTAGWTSWCTPPGA